MFKLLNIDKKLELQVENKGIVETIVEGDIVKVVYTNGNAPLVTADGKLVSVKTDDYNTPTELILDCSTEYSADERPINLDRIVSLNKYF